MIEKNIRKQGKKIVRRVLKKWNKFDNIGRDEFNEGLYIIIKNISQFTNIPIDKITQYTDQIVKEFGEDYEKIPDAMKGYEAIISLLYFKYMEKLDNLEKKKG